MTRTEAARTNGALSKGPVTEAGKAISSRNACKHALNSSQVVIAGENQADFDLLLEAFHEDYLPITVREEELVFELAANRWRMRRLIIMEKAVVEVEMDRLRSEKDVPATDPEIARAKAWLNIANSPAMKQIHRYESRLRRACEKAEKELVRLGQEALQRQKAIEAEENRAALQAMVQADLERARAEQEARMAKYAAQKPKSAAQNEKLQNEPKRETNPTMAATRNIQNEPTPAATAQSETVQNEPDTAVRKAA